MTIQSCSVGEKEFPQLEVKATRKPLETTPQNVRKFRIVYQVPNKRQIIYSGKISILIL